MKAMKTQDIVILVLLGLFVTYVTNKTNTANTSNSTLENNNVEKSKLIDAIFLKYPSVDVTKEFLMSKDLAYLNKIYSGEIR